MLITILAIVIALVAWSLHLMQQAVDRREFSLMLAGTLVAFSAAAMVGVYFLMGSYIGYVTGSSKYSISDAATVSLENRQIFQIEVFPKITEPATVAEIVP
ncbi:MAG: hypothetical protein WCA35_21645 [Kovacikia sp.]